MGVKGLPRWCSGKESVCRCRRCKFDPWVGKIPWRRKWQPILVLLPGKFHGHRSLVGYAAVLGVAKSQTQLSDFIYTFSNIPWYLRGKEHTCQRRRCRFNPWVGKIPWRREWKPNPVFFLENPMDREAWWATVHGVERVRYDLATEHVSFGNVQGRLISYCLELY